MAWATGLPAISRQPLPLRVRVALACTGIGLALSLLFAGTTVYMTEDMESIVVEQILRSEAANVANIPTAPVATPADGVLRRYVARGGDRRSVPLQIRDLPDGLQEFTDQDDVERMVEIYSQGRDRVYVMLDLNRIDQLEDRLNLALVLIVVLGTAISGGLGWWLAATSVRPVSRLAMTVHQLSTEPELTALATQYSHDEVGELAAAIDSYQQRLVSARDLERSFFAEASHELRTPLSVIRGVTDLFMDDGELSPVRRRRLRRLERGIGELSDKIEAMFTLARGRQDGLEFVNTEDLIQECLDDMRMHLPEQAVVRITGGIPLRLPPRQAQLVLRLALRAVLVIRGDSSLEVVLDGAACRLCARISQGVDAGAARHGDPRLQKPADGLVGRLASRIGWRMDETISSDVHEITVNFAPAERGQQED